MDVSTLTCSLIIAYTIFEPGRTCHEPGGGYLELNNKDQLQR
jgi:hypothetical protein